ncbi:hypothetical protein C0J52_27416 [Blattella germanica]|nr:hypothetical protein C0J52_27416 [Blattella germanica]
MVSPYSYCTKIRRFQYCCRQFITTLIISTPLHLSRGENILPIVHSTIIIYISLIKFSSTNNMGNTSKNLKIHYKQV